MGWQVCLTEHRCRFSFHCKRRSEDSPLAPLGDPFSNHEVPPSQSPDVPAGNPQPGCGGEGLLGRSEQGIGGFSGEQRDRLHGDRCMGEVRP